jgi:type VI secretion system protein ImpM
MNGDEITDPGFYGKLPVYGDFIQKRLPRDFIAPWDDWLQVGIAAIKSRLPDQWLGYYLNCPAWQFVLGDGLCGEQACAGVTIPSVDRVGRYFNFTLVSLLPRGTAPARFMARHDAWLQNLEDLALTILGDELDQDQIDEALARLGPPDMADLEERPRVEDAETGLQLTFSDIRVSAVMKEALLDELVRRTTGDRYGMWLLTGSSQVAPQLIVSTEMPGVEQFLDLMMGRDPAPDTEEASGDEVLNEFLSD